MIKECDYCSNEFEAKRADAKYCSGTCKNYAYIARKANPAMQGSEEIGQNTSTITRNNRQNVDSSLTIPTTTVNKLLQRQGLSERMIDSLLAEKDNIGEAKSSITEYRIRLMFMERDLSEANKKVEELTKENEKLWEKVENLDSSFGDKIINYCESNPTILMTFLEKFNSASAINMNSQNNK